MLKKCTLCGGRLSGGKCEFCGLNNSLYDRDYLKNSYEVPSASSTPAGRAVPHRQSSGGSSDKRQIKRRQKDPVPRRTPSRSSSKMRKLALLLIIAIILLFTLLPALIQAGKNILQEFSASYSVSSLQTDTGSDFYDDSSPYLYVTRDIPESGGAYETVLGNGYYLVGVHIPEGIYTAELKEGTGSFHITDEENMIYDYIWFGDDEEYNEVHYQEDIRLYNGAWVSIDDTVFLTLTTDNAQPLTSESGPNPSAGSAVILDADTYIVGEDFAEGIYDLYLETALDTADSSLELTYPDGNSDYLWMSNSSYSGIQNYYSDHGIKNVVLPAGTVLLLEGDNIVLQPSEEYFDIDYHSYSP